MLIAIKQANIQDELAQGIFPCSISSGNCEEGGSSSFQEDVSCSFVNNNNNNNNNCESNLVLDELYSCLMGGEEVSKYSLSWQNGKDLWVCKN